jgi:hypothetical protein
MGPSEGEIRQSFQIWRPINIRTEEKTNTSYITVTALVFERSSRDGSHDSCKVIQKLVNELWTEFDADRFGNRVCDGQCFVYESLL